MPKSKNVEGFLNTLEKVITCLFDLIKTANECVDEFQKI